VFDEERLRSELSDTSPSFRLAFGAATFAELLRGSPHAVELSYDAVYSVVEGARRRGSAEDEELLQLIETASQLAKDPVAVARTLQVSSPG
jgi:hypothetical protein